MDRVKLGRALGYGTRHAAKTLAAVAEAASAPAPRLREGAGAGGRAAAATTVRRSPAEQPQADRRASAAQVRGAGRSMWAPLATFSGALWLRVTGCFFGLVALTMASGVWRTRGALRPGADPGSLRHLWLFVGFAVLFGYFAVSSFVRASLRERRAAASGPR